jgi:predicted ATP-dependent endonuclease of OLD family
MKLKKLILENFKAYEKAEIDLNDITIIVGRNDSGKSTILQALNLFFNPKEANTKDIFFNDGQKTAEEILIECHFIIESNSIRLGDEEKEVNIIDTNLLTEEGDLVVGYKYNTAQKNATEGYIKCYNYDI